MPKLITVATDCSGIEAPLAALQNMNVAYDHLWSSDSNKFCKQMITSNHTPHVFFDDILNVSTRKKQLRPFTNKLDLYVVGFPCQSYSALTVHKDEEQRTTRIQNNALIIDSILKTIQCIHPKVIVIENVPLFMKQDDYTNVCTRLQRYKYDVYKEILNSKNYGVPQLRKRLYIVAIAQSVPKKKDAVFVYPPVQTKNCISLLKLIQKARRYKKDIIQSRNRLVPPSYQDFLKQHKKELKDHVFINIPSAMRHKTIPADKEHASCLTTNCKGVWNLTENRFATTSELLLLQGFDPSKLKCTVSLNQLTHQIGNSMTISVLQAIFRSVFDYVQF